MKIDWQRGDYALVKLLFGGYHTIPIKIAAVHQRKVGYHKVADKLNWVRTSLLEPIPLTPEILEKIGFYWGYTSSEEDSINNMPKEDIPIPLIMPDKHWCYDNEDGGEVTIELPNESDGGLVTVSNNDRRIEFIFDKPICLYELQHLLRLCRLNKLADNLKLEE
jgi:hypothetical protein